MDVNLDSSEEEFKALLDSRYVNGIRCKCGQVIFVRMPCLCSKCGDPKPYWKNLEGQIISLEKMDLGHLTNSVRMLGKKAESYPSGETRKELEIAIDLIYAEISTRDLEIKQDTGIFSALKRSLDNVS